MQVRRAGIVGSGQIGPDIALCFAKALSPSGAEIVVQDIAEPALAAGRERTERKVRKGVETDAFRPDEAERMLHAIRWTTRPEDLAGCDLVVEAATERLDVRRAILADLEGRVGPDAILASNSSHMEPEAIFAEMRRPERALVHHFFFPADRNPVVEVVPGARTSPGATEASLAFYESIGKVPIRVGSRYGYAIDPIFEGLFLAAALCVEAGLGTTKEVDAVARETLGLGVGPFTAMNLTGGNPITAHGLAEMNAKIMPWFRVPRILEEALASRRPWDVAGRDEKVAVDEARSKEIARRMRGAYFGLVGEVLGSGITNVADLEMAIELALVVRPPFAWMNEAGIEEAREYARATPGFRWSKVLEIRPWRIPLVVRRDRSAVAVLTIRRPKVLNAFNREVYAQLKEHLEAVRLDPALGGAVITGFGVKAFVSGADIGMLAGIKSPEEGAALSRSIHETMNLVENLGKPVVAALNGLSLGGGSELAYACTDRVARKGVARLFGQPEVRLGIIPGAGGTQRLPRLVDPAVAWRVLRTGGSLSGAEAASLGLIREEVEGDAVGRAVALVRELAEGRTRARPIPRGPVALPADLPDVDLAGLSRRVDEILRRAVVEGARLTLAEGLALEWRLFGEVCGTRDMRIGLENFLKTGGRSPAPFVHA